MSTEELQKRTTVNIQEKANLIWAIADKLVGTYKPHEYGNVILTTVDDNVPERFELLKLHLMALMDDSVLVHQSFLFPPFHIIHIFPPKLRSLFFKHIGLIDLLALKGVPTLHIFLQ